MKINRFRIKNYMGFQDTGELEFSPCMNLIVGQNNVGKSSLLKALAIKFMARPHRSEAVLATLTSPLNPISSGIVEFGTTGQEVKEIMQSSGQPNFFFPTLPNFNANSENMEKVIGLIFESENLEFLYKVFSASASKPTGLLEERFPCHGLFHVSRSNQYKQLHVIVQDDRQTFKPHGITNAKGDQDFAYPVGNTLRERISFFHAERLQVSSSQFGQSEVLQSDSANLPEVLNMLHTTNPAQYREVIGLVRTVIPTVKWVSVVPEAGNTLQIRVWPIEETSQRKDLAIPLNECGTGVGQVLAMLYVVVTANFPRVILIDEPASFLHPGASRKLMSILKNYSQHQYIISTHSPEIIALAQSSPIFLVTSDGTESIVEQIDPSQLEQARRVLIEVGAKLSDVYGADNIVWVEGPTEQECFPLIASKFELGNAGTVFRAVLDTGRLQSKRTRESILEIYRRLSQASALIPPALAFVFDKENLSETDIDDLKRIDGVHIIKRRMYENYLIDAEAITEVLNSTETFRDQCSIEPKDIETWLKDAIGDEDHDSIDGADILKRLISEISDAKEEYRKTVHSVELTRILLEKDPERFSDIRELLEEVLTVDQENQSA